MEEKVKILYLSHDTRVAVHNAVFAGISRYAAMRGWTAESVNYRLSHGRSLSELLAEKRPVGCIVECSNGPPDLPPAAFGRVPAVFMNCLSVPRGRRIARVAVDNGSVAAAAFRELSSGNPDGFAAVGLSDPAMPDGIWSNARVAAFRALCRKARRRCLCLVDWGRGGDESDARLREWIAEMPPRTAVFAVNDATAASIARAAKAAGRSIPRDFTLVGVDNDAALCEAASPPLSSIPMDFENGGFLAARTLAERILHPGSAGFQPADTARPEAAPPSTAGRMPALRHPQRAPRESETTAGDRRSDGNPATRQVPGAEPKRRRKRREKYVADAKPHSAATSRWVMEVERSRWQARESRVSSMRSRIVFPVAWNRRSAWRRLVPIAVATVETTVVSDRDSIPGSPMTEKSRQSAAGSGTG